MHVRLVFNHSGRCTEVAPTTLTGNGHQPLAQLLDRKRMFGSIRTGHSSAVSRAGHPEVVTELQRNPTKDTVLRIPVEARGQEPECADVVVPAGLIGTSAQPGTAQTLRTSHRLAEGDSRARRGPSRWDKPRRASEACRMMPVAVPNAGLRGLEYRGSLTVDADVTAMLPTGCPSTPTQLVSYPFDEQLGSIRQEDRQF
ncbi:hypothetical protein OBBRIDRAFT_806232 [Obba rivulosa]|uniref:Uncharacterized protein n=1 Tax=Obba rivulosa TaxID=1052685 RepID=A0A8E2AM60_9APHY|nr:hypothetical protein OBBRIDRAFT_806232 [Obba rivulosa]